VSTRSTARSTGASPPPAAAGAAPPPLPRDQRPREKLRARGAGSLSDAELLALVLGSGTARRSAQRVGRQLARAAALCAAFELGRRAAARPAPRAAIRGPEDVRLLVRDLEAARKEHFVVLLLNARHEVEKRETVSIGSLNASIVHPREVFQPAILHSAASVVLVHNHPSGDPEPSEEDLSITRRLVQVGDLVGIGVLDHVIIAARGVVSLRARQLL